MDNPATADFETSKGVKVVESFEDMNLKDELLRGIYDFGTNLADKIDVELSMPKWKQKHTAHVFL